MGWCEICQEICSDHPTICSVCGANLTSLPPPSSATAATTATTTDGILGSSANTNNNANRRDVETNERLLEDMRSASRDLNMILGNLRGQVQDLDNLTRNILQQPTGDDNNVNSIAMLREALDPQNQSNDPSSIPTSKEILSKIPRFVLNEKSTLFRQAKLHLHETSALNDGSSNTSATVTSIIPANAMIRLTESAETDESTTRMSKEENNNQQFMLNLDCVVGEFGPAKEYDFEMNPLILASPYTGKGGNYKQGNGSSQFLSDETKSQISHLRLINEQVIVFMGRGDGLTFVQKALLAQDAGASAVIIGNNTPKPWPYVMKDSKGEAEKEGRKLMIPAVIIKEFDAKRLLQRFENQKRKLLKLHLRKNISVPNHHPFVSVPKQIIITKNNEKSSSGGGETTNPSSTHSHNDERKENQMQESNNNNHHNFCHILCDLRISKTQTSDCVICCESLKNSDTVLQVPGCAHIFHEECALTWLKSHNTCPYCRLELPTDDPEYERERRLRQQQQRTTGSTTTGENTNPDTNAFYR